MSLSDHPTAFKRFCHLVHSTVGLTPYYSTLYSSTLFGSDSLLCMHILPDRCNSLQPFAVGGPKLSFFDHKMMPPVAPFPGIITNYWSASHFFHLRIYTGHLKFTSNVPSFSSRDSAGLQQPLPVSSVLPSVDENLFQWRHSSGMAGDLQSSSSTLPAHLVNSLHTLELLWGS